MYFGQWRQVHPGSTEGKGLFGGVGLCAKFGIDLRRYEEVGKISAGWATLEERARVSVAPTSAKIGADRPATMLTVPSCLRRAPTLHATVQNIPSFLEPCARIAFWVLR